MSGRIIEARGPAVEALKRYDPGLRVRWSWQKQCWAVDAPYKFTDKDPRHFLLPPVRYERVGDKGDRFVERLLPELSDRMIEYRDRRYVVCHIRSGMLDRGEQLVAAIRSKDSHRDSGRMVGQLDRHLEAQRVAKQKRAEFARSERVYEGWDRFRHSLRRAGAGVEDGAGVSIKGMA